MFGCVGAGFHLRTGTIFAPNKTLSNKVDKPCKKLKFLVFILPQESQFVDGPSPSRFY